MGIIKNIEFKSKANAIFIALIIMSFIFSIAAAQDINIQDQESINGDQKEEVEKDNWDKISAVSGLITSGLIALIIALLANHYRKKEISIMTTNVVLGFFKYLEKGDLKMMEASLKTILSFDTDTGIDLCKTFPDVGYPLIYDLRDTSKKAKAAIKKIEIKDEEEVDKIVALDEEGKNIEEIAQEIGRPRGAIIFKMEQLVDEKKLDPRSFSIDAPETIEKIIELYNAGENTSTIAHEVRHPFRVVRLKIEQLVKEGKLKAR